MKYMYSLLAVLLLCHTMTANAALITVEHDKDQYLFGETIVSKLYLSDFSGPLTGAVLSFSVNSGMDLQQWQIGDAFDDGAGDYRFGDVMAGQLFLEAYADWAASLTRLAQKQSNRFLFATISWRALQSGVFNFSFDQSYSGVLDKTAQFNAVAVQQRSASVLSVNNPTSLVLILTSAFVAVSFRRRIRE